MGFPGRPAVRRTRRGARSGVNVSYALPVEQPITFDLVMNTKSAKALSFTIRPSDLVRAEVVGK